MWPRHFPILSSSRWKQGSELVSTEACPGESREPDKGSRSVKDDDKVPVIAIDGPSGSGKGTVAKRIAQQLGFHYLDSGALYRAVALKAREHGVSWDDEGGLAKLAAALELKFEGDQVLLGNEDVGFKIRGEELS